MLVVYFKILLCFSVCLIFYINYLSLRTHLQLTEIVVGLFDCYYVMFVVRFKILLSSRSIPVSLIFNILRLPMKTNLHVI